MNSQAEWQPIGPAAAWIAVRSFLSPAQARIGALVLAAAGVNVAVRPFADRIALWVSPADADRASYELEAYDRENRRPSPAQTPSRPLSDGVSAAMFVVLMLVFLHWAANRHAFGADWISAGAADAGAIAHGQVDRVLTALGLHAGFDHLVSNLLAGALFGLLLAQVVGSGLAWLLMLLAGAGGNWVNALLDPAGHTAIGASTAVFGGLGALVVLMLAGARSTWRRGVRRWVPLGAGVMLLALTGTAGDHTDVGAHFAGFAAGALAGAALILAWERVPRGQPAQLAYGAAAAALFAGAWVIALLRTAAG